MNCNSLNYYMNILRNKPAAKAIIRGSDNFPDILGSVNFYQTKRGVLLAIEVQNLPEADNCRKTFLGFHIHNGESCSGNSQDPFADAKTHYNPFNTEHPCHSGDLPPLLNNNGYAFQIFLTNRFTVKNIIGKTIIIHSQADDFTTQPSGDSGNKIACGVIKSIC